MPVKIITVDLEAYDLLATRKRVNESFSDVIKRTLGPKPTMGDLLRAVRRYPLSEETLSNVDLQSRRMRAEKLRRMK